MILSVIILTKPLYPGTTLARRFTFKDENRQVYDPSTVTVKVKTPAGSVVTTQTLSDLSKESTGVYVFRYNLEDEAPSGQWKIEVSATYEPGNLADKKVFTFDVLPP